MSLSYSVGIPVRNEENTIEDCIKSVLSQTIKPDEIFVCVNGSTDSTLDIVTNISKKTSLVKVLQSKPGKALAWNKIVAGVNNNTVMFVDGDTLVSKNSAENLLNELELNSELCAVSGTVAYKKPSDWSFASFFHDEYDKPVDVYSLVGALYMFRKDRLVDIAERNNVNMMPYNIVNEDGYLARLLGTDENGMKVINSAYVTINPVNSLKDWFNMFYRLADGEKQLDFEYSHIKSQFGVNKSRGTYLVNKFMSVPGLKRKSGLFLQFALRKALSYGVYAIPSKEYNYCWTESCSTKKSLL